MANRQPERNSWDDFKDIVKNAQRSINYLNSQWFEAFWGYFINPVWTGQYHWEYHNGTHKKKPAQYQYVAPILHYVAGFFARLVVLPFTSTCYVLSRLFLVALNPPYWRRNIAKSVMTGLMFSLLFLSIANNVYAWLPQLTFPQLFHFDQLNTVYDRFGFREGGWLFDPHVIAGMVAGMMVVTAFASMLYLGKGLGKLINAKKMEDPDGTKDFVYVTAPKYANIVDMKDNAHKTKQEKNAKQIKEAEQALKSTEPQKNEKNVSGTKHTGGNLEPGRLVGKRKTITLAKNNDEGNTSARQKNDPQLVLKETLFLFYKNKKPPIFEPDADLLSYKGDLNLYLLK